MIKLLLMACPFFMIQDGPEKTIFNINLLTDLGQYDSTYGCCTSSSPPSCMCTYREYFLTINNQTFSFGGGYSAGKEGIKKGKKRDNVYKKITKHLKKCSK